MKKTSENRLNNINLLRFLFCMYVVYFHIQIGRAHV